MSEVASESERVPLRLTATRGRSSISAVRLVRPVVPRNPVRPVASLCASRLFIGSF